MHNTQWGLLQLKILFVHFFLSKLFLIFLFFSFFFFFFFFFLIFQGGGRRPTLAPPCDENLSWKSHIEMVGNKISKVTGILYRLKNVFPENVLFVLYNSLIVSYMNYGLLLWGIHSHKLELLQKKALRLMTNSNYLAHTTPLLIKHGLLNVRDMYKLKLLKFYYKLSYDLLPPYFNKYIEIIVQKPARDLRFQYIHAPLVKRVYAECSPLFQPIKLINSLRNDPNDTILKKLLKRVIRITVLLSMLQELSWIIMIPSAEQKSVMFATFNETIMRCLYLVIIIIGNICVY